MDHVLKDHDGSTYAVQYHHPGCYIWQVSEEVTHAHTCRRHYFGLCLVDGVSADPRHRHIIVSNSQILWQCNTACWIMCGSNDCFNKYFSFSLTLSQLCLKKLLFCNIIEDFARKCLVLKCFTIFKHVFQGVPYIGIAHRYAVVWTAVNWATSPSSMISVKCFLEILTN